MKQSKPKANKVVLITGAARRIGAQIARQMHENNYNVIIHYSRSKTAATALVETLNTARQDSARMLAADLKDIGAIEQLASLAIRQWGRLDVLINNASTFYPTPFGMTQTSQWDELIAVNLKAPFFLTQAVASELKQRRGSIVNIADIYADRPLKGYSPYCAAKAGLVNLTRALAAELAPEVRVNGIAPGAILWPEDNRDDEGDKNALLSKTPMNRLGDPGDIARTVLFLAQPEGYITGQIITVDGGRSVVA